MLKNDPASKKFKTQQHHRAHRLSTPNSGASGVWTTGAEREEANLQNDKLMFGWLLFPKWLPWIAHSVPLVCNERQSTPIYGCHHRQMGFLKAFVPGAWLWWGCGGGLLAAPPPFLSATQFYLVHPRGESDNVLANVKANDQKQLRLICGFVCWLVERIQMINLDSLHLPWIHKEHFMGLVCSSSFFLLNIWRIVDNMIIFLRMHWLQFYVFCTTSRNGLYEKNVTITLSHTEK